MTTNETSKIVFVAIVFALLACYPLVSGNFGVDLVSKIMVYAIFALSLELLVGGTGLVGSSRVDLQACKLEYSIVSPK